MVAPMAKQFREIEAAHAAFIAKQHIFFVASAAGGSHVNLSPRSTDSLRVLGPQAVAYLDRTGSGNETAAHIRAGGRITIMLCAFDGAPLILRLYGRGTVHRRSTAAFADLLGAHFGDVAPLGTRQIVSLEVELVQTSCGFGVPLFDYRAERDVLDRWAERKGEAGIESYWREKNLTSLDGLPTGLLEAEPVAG
jgi:Pyridoxamine 5'-phosphate oxidase